MPAQQISAVSFGNTANTDKVHRWCCVADPPPDRKKTRWEIPLLSRVHSNTYMPLRSECDWYRLAV